MEICPKCEVYISGQGFPEECPVCTLRRISKPLQENPGWDKTVRLEQMKQELIHGHFTLTEVIEAVIEINGLVGVGIISLGDDLRNFCYEQVGGRQSVS